jgi:hypothetical protein
MYEFEKKDRPFRRVALRGAFLKQTIPSFDVIEKSCPAI